MKSLSLVVITGLSGSGKTTALRVLEDLGFFCIDNLPTELLSHLIELIEGKTKNKRISIDKLAIVIDARGETFFKDLNFFVQGLKRRSKRRILYLESREDVLIQRYSETRRRHPLASQGSVLEGIHQEEKILSPMRRTADKIIDTSDLNVHELKQLLVAYFHRMAPQGGMHVTLISFGYKYGVPIQSDLIFDVRFLPNPFFEKQLQKKTGLSPTVQKFVLDRPVCRTFLSKIENLLTFLIREYKQEGKSYLTIAFGCTGGKHRSIAFVEKFKQVLAKQKIATVVVHRDLKM